MLLQSYDTLKWNFSSMDARNLFEFSIREKITRIRVADMSNSDKFYLHFISLYLYSIRTQKLIVRACDTNLVTFSGIAKADMNTRS